MGPRDVLGPFEFQVLSLLTRNPTDSYGAMLHQRLAEVTGRELSVGALYTTLARLEKKGFISSAWGEATPERGGRRKRFYHVEAPGRMAMARTTELARSFDDVGGFVPVVA